MSNAVELYTATPKKHNCAQAVAEGCGHPELVAELAVCGGGKAPGGRCGALHAAMLLVPEAAEAIQCDFVAQTHSDLCSDLKQLHRVSCPECVRIAADLVAKYR